MKITIITPWLDHPELILGYEPAVRGAEVIVIDNGSKPENAAMIERMVKRLGGKYIRNDTNAGYAKANNQGLAEATGELVIFLNNDIEAAPGWMKALDACRKGALYGPNLITRYVDGAAVYYLEGWCLCGFTDDFRALNGWNDRDFPGYYWEDNELCWRASRAGLALRPIGLQIRHLDNYTSKQTPGAYERSGLNRAVFEGMVRDAR